MTETAFYIELPADEYGNTAMPKAVVEARLYPNGGPGPLSIPDRPAMVPVAPERFTQGWPSGWYEDSYGGWAEVEGPARMLTRPEWSALVERVLSAAGKPLPGWLTQARASR